METIGLINFDRIVKSGMKDEYKECNFAIIAPCSCKGFLVFLVV
jgi:hypothetical protein